MGIGNSRLWKINDAAVDDNKIFVWRKSYERQGVVRAFFWGCITYNGMGTLSLHPLMETWTHRYTLKHWMTICGLLLPKNWKCCWFFKRTTFHVMSLDNVMPGIRKTIFQFYHDLPKAQTSIYQEIFWEFLKFA